MQQRTVWALLGALAFFLTGGCSRVAPETNGHTRPAGEDLVRYATHLSIVPQGTRTWVQLRTPGAQASERDTLTLWLPSTPAPGTTLVALSTTQTAMVEVLHAEAHLVGIGQVDYLYSQPLKAAAATGKLAAVAPGGTLNPERVLALAPTYLLLAANGSEGASLEAIRAAGVTVLPVSDWLEAHPLGRMEWVLLIGALTGRLKEAQAYADSVIAAYEALRVQLAGVQNRPVVIAGSPYDAVWYVPGGNSYLARLIEDAGGAYPWSADASTGSLALSLENVLPIARQADFWLNPGQVPDQAAIEAAHPELRATRPMQTRSLYGYYNRLTPEGGNDYFERGALEPHVVLADMASLFHPNRLPGHTRVYYRHLP